MIRVACGPIRTQRLSEDVMRLMCLGLVATALLCTADPVWAQTNAALSGQVTSAEEGAMEGILVTAKKGTIATTVVSDKDGRYSFPPGRLDPGAYAIAIRAVGYEPEGKLASELAANQPATLDIKLRKTRRLSTQLTNAEWMESAPGTAQQKATLFNCVSCHTVERIVKSTHDAASFVQTMGRMAGYANQSTPLHPQRRVAQRLLEERGEARDAAFRQRAEWLASVNLSEGTTWEYPLKTFPRPSGRATRVIITEYDLPRP